MNTFPILQHGPDGLSNISETHPHFTPPEIQPGDMHAHLDTSPKPSYEVILDILRAEPDDSVTIVALGPCEFFFFLCSIHIKR